jgi:hypothetical protein
MAYKAKEVFMNQPMLILVAGAYRSGTNDNPEKMRTNLRMLEATALELFRMGTSQ